MCVCVCKTYTSDVNTRAVFVLQFPEHRFYNLVDKILLFRHDPFDPNVLQILSNPADIKDNCLVEVVLSGQFVLRWLNICSL